MSSVDGLLMFLSLCCHDDERLLGYVIFMSRIAKYKGWREGGRKEIDE